MPDKARLIRDKILRDKRMYAIGGEVTYAIPTPKNKYRTTLMRYIEDRFRTPLEVLLVEGSLEEVSRKLNISKPTVIKWRRGLGLMQPQNSELAKAG